MNAVSPALLIGTIPRPLTSLIGRTREIAEVSDLLRRDDVQLVTLTGPGGVGKTRLAIATATAIEPDFPEGVHFIDLSPLRDPAHLASEVAHQIGLRGASESLPLLLAAISDRSLLLVLDNFEQVVEAASVVAELLERASRLRILVTSREPLKVGGEREYPIAPFPVTGVDTDKPGERPYAEQLFAERAQAVVPSFSLTIDNADDVSEICRRLDGLPLAIELAAARVKTLPPSILLARLDRRLPLLTGSRRDAPRRQQTMRDAIAWSYEQLAPSEQSLFRQLGVFVGGCSLEAVESVAGSDSLDDLESMIDKSLIRQETSDDNPPRYLMLETVREFALEQLVASNENEAVRNSHEAWCREFAEDWRSYGDAKHQPEMAGRTPPLIEPEFDNIRAALRWLEASGNIEGLARLAGTVWYYWVLHGSRNEGLYWLEQARSIDTTTAYNKTSKLWVMQGICDSAANQGRTEEAIAAAQECLALAQELADPISQATAQAMLGYIAFAEGEYERAEPFIYEAIRLNDSAGHWRAVATDRILLGMVAYGRGDLDLAAAILRETIEIHRTTEDISDLGLAVRYLALVRCEQGEVQAAASLYIEALQLWRSGKSLEDLSEVLAGISALATSVNAHELGARLMAAASGIRDFVRQQVPGSARAAFRRAEQAQREALGKGAFEQSWLAGTAMTVDKAVASAFEFLGSVQAPIASARRPAPTPTPFGLTAREIDVLRLLAEGQTDKEIADALFIGVRTAESHVANLLAKLGARNRAEAAVMATREHLV
jgi:non-specific serine/threonine protein kinase